MPDDQPLEPLRKAEPVALLDIAKALVAVAAFVGLDLAEDLVLQVVVGVNAAVLLVAATLATRRRVTPVYRAEAAEAQAYKDGLSVGDAIADREPPTATVVQVAGDPDVDRILAGLKRLAADVDHVDVDRIADPPPAPTFFAGSAAEPDDAGHP